MTEVPVSQAILAKTTVFTQVFLKKKHFDQNTQLCVGFAKIKSFHSQNTQFWADFENKLTPSGTKQKIHECLLKEALSPFFSVTLKSKKTYSYQWKPKNKGLLLFKIIPLVL